MTEMKIIARIRTELPEKFGVPRQSGLVPQLRGRVIFEPEYRNPDAVRGLEDFSHIWLIWQFSRAVREGWSPTVRPPRLGGNRRMGVFATRSPFLLFAFFSISMRSSHSNRPLRSMVISSVPIWNPTLSYPYFA